MFATKIHCCHAKMVKLDALNYIEEFIEQVTHWSVVSCRASFFGGAVHNQSSKISGAQSVLPFICFLTSFISKFYAWVNEAQINST